MIELENDYSAAIIVINNLCKEESSRVLKLVDAILVNREFTRPQKFSPHMTY